MLQEVKIIFEPKTFVDIILAALVCDVEISGLAKVEKSGSQYVIYDEPIIFKQACCISRTTFDETAYMLWQEKMVIDGTHEEIQKARLWWHSHVWAPVGFSDRDENTLDLMGQDFDWWLALVVNKRYQAYMELREYKPRILSGVIIQEYEFTQNISRGDLKKLLEERRGRMELIVKEKVNVLDPVADDDD